MYIYLAVFASGRDSLPRTDKSRLAPSKHRHSPVSPLGSGGCWRAFASYRQGNRKVLSRRVRREIHGGTARISRAPEGKDRKEPRQRETGRPEVGRCREGRGTDGSGGPLIKTRRVFPVVTRAVNYNIEITIIFFQFLFLFIIIPR